jgi:hypothetical protein
MSFPRHGRCAVRQLPDPTNATLFERGAAANPARRLRAFPNWGCPDGQSRRLGRQSNASFCRDAEIDANLGGPSPIGWRSREHLWVARARGNAPYDPPLAYDEEPLARAEASRGARDVLVLLRGQNTRTLRCRGPAVCSRFAVEALGWVLWNVGRPATRSS